MPIDRQVSCIRVLNPLIRENIIKIGGTHLLYRWQEDEPVAIAQIERGSHTYFTMENGKRAEVRVDKPKGKKPYLTTSPDGYKPNNLLSLPDCP